MVYLFWLSVHVFYFFSSVLVSNPPPSTVLTGDSSAHCFHCMLDFFQFTIDLGGRTLPAPHYVQGGSRSFFCYHLPLGGSSAAVLVLQPPSHPIPLLWQICVRFAQFLKKKIHLRCPFVSPGEVTAPELSRLGILIYQTTIFGTRHVI